jgi:hypothetical protein
VALTIGSLVVAMSASADATCAYIQLGPRVMTTRVTALPADGGVLVGYAGRGAAGDAAADDPSHAAGWVATDGRKHAVAMTRVSLAPGLSVYKLGGDAATTIATSDGKPVGAFTHDAKAAPNAMPAPQATGATTKSEPSFRSTVTTSTVTLATAPPPEAVALIVYAAGAPVAYGQFADTHDTAKSVVVYEGGGHCGLPVPGHALASEAYTFAFVDAFGRLSPQSKPVAGR